MSVGRKRRSRFRVGDRVTFLYGPQRVSGTIAEDRGPLGVYGRRIYLVRVELGEGETTTFEILEEDMDDPAELDVESEPGTRQEFKVTYDRQGKSNRWSADTRRGAVYQGMKAEGAVAYTTGRWEGEGEEDERHAVVSVFLEPGPLSDEETLNRRARQHADRMFRKRHADAEIEELAQHY